MISYRWRRDGVNVVGATGPSYTLGDASPDVSHGIDVVARSTPMVMARPRAVTSAATSAVSNTSTADPPIGFGDDQQDGLEGNQGSDGTSNTLSDADGLGAIGYQVAARRG